MTDQSYKGFVLYCRIIPLQLFNRSILHSAYFKVDLCNVIWNQICRLQKRILHAAGIVRSMWETETDPLYRF